MSTTSKYSLNDFNRHGKIDLCRLIFAWANVEFEDKCAENLTDSDKQFAMMPFLDARGVKIPLVSVISRFLAREFNIAGKDNLQQAKADAIAQTCMLNIDTYYTNVFNIEDYDQKRLGLKSYLDNDVDRAADACETLIKLYSDSKTGWCVGDSLTYADLFVYEMAEYYFPKDEARFTERFPNIYKVHNNVKNEARLSAYFKSLGPAPNLLNFL